MSDSTLGDRHGGDQWKDKLEKLLEGLSHFDLTNDVYEETPHLQAHGGFCDVFKAKSRRHEGISIAVKRLRIHILKDKNISKIFCTELKIWSSLNHPNVLPLLGFVMHSKYPAFASQWMANGTMRKYLETNPEIRKLTMAEGIAEGLKYLHEQNVVHSDLKPDNILISSSGTPLLADFGISRLMTATATTTSSGLCNGSARYMAMELLKINMDGGANSGLHTKATDVWAYGMVVYELLTGSVPFSPLKNDLQVAMAIINGQTPGIPSLLDTTNVDNGFLWEVCQSCWEKSPTDRPTMVSISNTFSTFAEAFPKDSDLRVENADSSNMPKFNEPNTQSVSERATELHTDPLPNFPASGPVSDRMDRRASLNNLANSFLDRYNKKGSQNDLEQSIELHMEALVLCPPGHQHRSFYLNDLANALIHRCIRSNIQSDLARVIELHTEALALCPPNHRHRTLYLNNLANALMNRYVGMRTHSDLEQVIELRTEVLVVCPRNHQDRNLYLDNLANALLKRYLKMRTQSDLERAIKLHLEALALCPPDHEDRRVSLSNLANTLFHRYSETGTKSDLESVLGLHSEALDLCPLGDPDRSLYLNNLATVLKARFERTGSLLDLEWAIELNSAALILCPPGHNIRSVSLKNLASVLIMRHDRSGVRRDLERGIECYTEALELYPPGHEDRPRILVRLSSALRRKENTSKNMVFRLLREGSMEFTSQLDFSLDCARLWVQYGREVGDHYNTRQAYANIFGLLWRHLPIWPIAELRYDAMCRRVGIFQFPMDAAAHAIETDDVEKAVELVDAGRSLLWPELLQFHAGSLLQNEVFGKELAEDFDAVCSELRGFSAETKFDASLANLMLPVNEDVAGISYDILLSRKQMLIERYKSQLRRIKEIRGSAGFLECPSFTQLQSASTEGPIIIVNCSEYGSHVIIVLANRPPSVTRLDGAFQEIAHSLYKKMQAKTLIHRRPESFERVLEEAAAFLWDEVAEGVVKKLKAEKVPEGSRIWWCPTSFLIALPFHAAGNKKESLIDFYISSYTPTLRSLIDARRFSSASTTGSLGPLNEPHPRILLVAQAQESLNMSSAKRELDIMCSKLGPVLECLEKDKSTNRAVLGLLQSHNWAHFICHGTVSAHPLDSSLELYGNKLRFNDINEARLRQAEFAFVASCHTAEQTLSPLGSHDEVLHLAGAMFLSGFQSVVGTMWNTGAEVGPEVAEKFYEEMFRDDYTSAQKPRHTRAAHALWKVTKQLKNEKKMGLLSWASFIHIGV